MKKMFAVIAIVVLVAMVLPACTPTAPDCTKPDVFCVGMVTDVGKIDDKSFNQSAWEGVQQAKSDGVADWVQYIETTDAKDYDKNIATFADAGYDVIVTVGFALGDATRTAGGTYPNVYFIGVDQGQTDTIANVTGLVFPEDQAGFLVGALAAAMSTTHNIGAVCGTDAVPAVWRYGEGYKAGAAYADAQLGTMTDVFVVYHSDVGFDMTFTDPTWGAQTADSMIANGADVIFGAGGKTGNGAVDEAAAKGVYAIGVDVDQYYTLPEAAPMLLSSAMKLETPGVAALIKAAKDAQSGIAAFPAGNYLGTAGYAPYHDLDSKVPANVKSMMETLNTGLMNGTIQTNVLPAKP
jgi:basic membrane protein A and related proteins